MAAPGAIAPPSKWKRAGLTVLAITGAIAGLAAADLLFHLRPLAAEQFWRAGLISGLTPLQEQAAFRLRNYPTRGTAAALVVYINARARAGDFQLASRAAETLCVLSGRSFGTSFTEHAKGHFWRSPEQSQWPDVLAEINQWAERALGARP